MNPDASDKDPAFPVMAMDILSNVLSRSDNPGDLGTYLMEEVRDLTGARCVLLIQWLDTPTVTAHRVVSVNPLRRREWAESPAGNRLYEVVHRLSAAQLWRGEEPLEVAGLLRREGFELSMVFPLHTGEFRVGALLVLGLPDEEHITSVLNLLNNLSTIVALVLRNAILYEKQEQLIQERTTELREKNEKLAMELTERKRAGDALHQSEERFRRLAENAQDLIYRMSLPDGKYEYVSPAALSVCGYSPEEYYKNPMLIKQAIHPDWQKYFEEQWANLINGEMPPMYEYQFIHKSGEVRWLNQRNMMVRDHAGNPMAIEGIVTDITERKRTEDTIRALNETLESRLLALTQPVGDLSSIQLSVLFNVDELQKIQDAFALAAGVASIITDTQGRPITKPSNFCQLCEHIIRKTEKGLLNCYSSDESLGRMHPKGPILQRCLSGGLWDAGTSICVGDRHIANWLIGQVLEEPGDEEAMLAYAGEIGADKEAFRKALSQVTRMPLKQFEKAADALYQIANQFSKLAIQNVQQARFITERKRAEEALRESDAKTRSILDNIGIGVALISPKMEILELNHRMRELFPAIDPGQCPICYRALNDPPREAACDHCPTRKTLQDGLVHEATKQVPHAGVIRNYRIVSSPVLNASGEVAAAIEMVEDITEKLSLESQLQQARKMESIGRLAGGVAHDFNNMLGVILGHTELALNHEDPAQPLYAPLLEIRKAAERSADLTRQLLAFARKQTVAPRVLDLNETVEGMLKMLRRLIGENIDLAWLPGAGGWSVKIDPSQIDQILANLCVNARDAISDTGKITIETHLATFDETYCADHPGFVPGQYVLLAVSDDGCGMDKETLSNLFEPFFTTKEMGRGTGLGLATVYGIVKQNNGFINVYSEPGRGTTLKIYLPRHAAKTEEMQKESPAAPVVRGHETLLLVEDEPAMLDIAKIILERLGYRVLAASTPGEAIRMAKEHDGEIRLLMTDVIMPEMNGRDLAKTLIPLFPGIRSLFMSGYTSDVIAHHGLLDEGVHFIQKPFSMQALAAKVREALDSK